MVAERTTPILRLMSTDLQRNQRADRESARFTTPCDNGRVRLNDDNPRLLGTRAWQRRRRHAMEARGKDYAPEREIKHLYRHLELMHDLVRRTNDRVETMTGHEVSAAMVNYCDLELAVEKLPSKQQRDCWNACVIGRVRRWNSETRQWYYEQIGRITYREAVGLIDMPSETEVAKTISRATAFIVCFLYEPE